MLNKKKCKKWWGDKWATQNWSIIDRECRWCKFKSFRWERLKRLPVDSKKWWQNNFNKYLFNNKPKNGSIRCRWRMSWKMRQSQRKQNRKVSWIAHLLCWRWWWMIQIHDFKILNFFIFWRESKINKSIMSLNSSIPQRILANSLNLKK